MTQAGTVPEAASPREPSGRSVRSLLQALEVDTRMLGMIAALAVIWISFNFMSGGTFLTPRNLWNLSVQSASIAIMATGMVLIIVSRNIDLSVGAMLGFIGYTMAMVQADWIPKTLGLGFDQPYIWIIALMVGMALGAFIGGIQGFLVAYGGVPSFIVTLGGLLVWRGLIFRYAQGQTIAPLDKIFQLLGGGPKGSIGDGAQLARRDHRLRGDPLYALGRPAPTTALRVPRPTPLGRGAHRRRRLRRRARGRRHRQRLLVARSPRQGLGGRARDPVAGRRPDHSDRHRDPGPDPARRRPRR